MKAIGFDWGGVLNGKPGGYFGQIVELMSEATLEDVKTAYFSHNQKVNRGEITWEQLWGLILTDLGHPDDESLLRDAIRISEEANADSLNLDMLELVDTLRRNNYKVGLLSNNTAEKAALMRERGLDRHFDAFDISVETGLVKPDPAAFQHLADALSVDIKELIFIDDTEKSLSTAKEVGFTPVLFESYDQLVSNLNALGVTTKG